MTRLIAAVALASAVACGGAGFDPQRMIATCGLDCTADELRFRLATDPRDRHLYTALAAVEDQRGRPGAALAALEAAERLGRPLRGGVGGADEARLGRLLVARARARVARRSPGAEADVARARTLGAPVPAALARDAALVAIAADLRHSDPRRRHRGRARLHLVDPTLAGALEDARAMPREVERAAIWLDAAGARRALYELLARFEVAQGAAGFAAMADPVAGLDRWLASTRGWAGPDGRPDLSTLERALVAGANPCWFPAADRARCDVALAAGSPLADGPDWEPALVDAWERDGVRATGRAQALAWIAVALRAEGRGQLGSASRAIRDHVDLDALARDEALPRWARAALAALDDDEAPLPATDDLPPGPRRAVELLVARRASATTPPWPDVVARVAAGDTPALAPALVAVVVGYLADPALADRRGEEVLARAVDVAEAAPRLARLFAILGDPARARALWQRGFDADPDDPALALGLALAIADAGDSPAALQLMSRAAAGSGDPATTLYRGARGFAAAGQPLAALTLTRQAIELSAPGDEDAPAGLAIALLGELGRTDAARGLAPLVGLPSAWDLTDVRAAIAREVAAAARADHHGRAVVRLMAIATAADPAGARLAQAALRQVNLTRRSAPTRPAPGLR